LLQNEEQEAQRRPVWLAQHAFGSTARERDGQLRVVELDVVQIGKRIRLARQNPSRRDAPELL
jgi:hypothetical protein